MYSKEELKESEHYLVLADDTPTKNDSSKKEDSEKKSNPWAISGWVNHDKVRD